MCRDDIVYAAKVSGALETQSSYVLEIVWEKITTIAGEAH